MVSERIRRLDDRGWTLAELLVVIAVIGILTAVSVPLFVSYLQSATVRAGAQELRTALNGAKQLAITLRQSICLQPTGGSAYQLRQTTTTCAAGVFVPATSAPGADATGTFRLQNNVALTVNTAPVFSPLGGAAPAGQFTVTGPTGSSLTVTVSSAGRITTP